MVARVLMKERMGLMVVATRCYNKCLVSILIQPWKMQEGRLED